MDPTGSRDIGSHNVRNDTPPTHQDADMNDDLSEDDVEQRHLQARRTRFEVGCVMRFGHSAECQSRVGKHRRRHQEEASDEAKVSHRPR